jgi:hypothetical protein
MRERKSTKESAQARVRRGISPRQFVSMTEIDDRGELLAREHPIDRSVSAQLSAGDVDARWDQAESTGEETAGGSVATPDQDIVDEIGRAIGITYQEGEPLRVGAKEHDRDVHRWELDPASSEDFGTRTAASERAVPVMKMQHRDRYGKSKD